MSHQISFFAPVERILAASGDAEVRYVPDVLTADESASFFRYLRESVAWDESTMWMYDHEVSVPRLVAWYGASDPLPPRIDAMRARMCERFDAPFNGVGMNLYRDERDSVAWHSDRNEGLIERPTVAILSLGETREMHVRPKAPPRKTTRIELEPGSVLLMTGSAQDRFEHSIPKRAEHVGERISVVFRTKLPALADPVS